MAWANSRVFVQWMIGPMLQSSGTGYTGLDSDTVKAALFATGATPDNDAAVGSTGYLTGTWVTANEITDDQVGGADWVSGGIALATKTFTSPAVGDVMFDAADTASGASATLTAAFGAFVYDDTITAGTVADQGLCYNYFGGSQSVTNGTFTIVWNATDGIILFGQTD